MNRSHLRFVLFLSFILCFIAQSTNAQSFSQRQIDGKSIEILPSNLLQNNQEDKMVIPLTNRGGSADLMDYPVRPEYNFPGPEVVYQLPPMEGMVFLEVGDRVPDVEVDLFVVTDPQDAGSAVLWLNGTDTKKCFNPESGITYYLVIDGFEGKTADVNFSMQLLGSTTACQFSNIPIDMHDFLTLGQPVDMMGNWERKSGTGGFFDADNGIYIPLGDGTDSVFEYTYPGCAAEEIVVTLIDCGIPSMSQWGVMVLGLFFMIMGILVIKEKFSLKVFS